MVKTTMMELNDTESSCIEQQYEVLRLSTTTGTEKAITNRSSGSIIEMLHVRNVPVKSNRGQCFGGPLSSSVAKTHHTLLHC
jgi:hypothetical protein